MVLNMKLKELLSVANVSDICVSTKEHDHYYSIDGGLTFRASCSNYDPDISEELHEREVKCFEAVAGSHIEITVE